jgi:hypothetical protein
MNRHQYPAMEYIRPYKTNYVVSDDRVLESIHALSSKICYRQQYN